MSKSHTHTKKPAPLLFLFKIFILEIYVHLYNKQRTHLIYSINICDKIYTHNTHYILNLF